jgi:hypothetical protein
LANHKLFISSMNFSLKRNIMTFVCYFGYQNSRAIHTEKGILPVLLFLQQNKTVPITMTKRLSSVKEGLQSYCNTVYSRSSFNTMWILKYSYDLLILEKFICPKHDLNSLHTIRLENASTR